jgi:hypothetical protein
MAAFDNSYITCATFSFSYSTTSKSTTHPYPVITYSSPPRFQSSYLSPINGRPFQRIPPWNLDTVERRGGWISILECD